MKKSSCICKNHFSTLQSGQPKFVLSLSSSNQKTSDICMFYNMVHKEPPQATTYQASIWPCFQSRACDSLTCYIRRVGGSVNGAVRSTFKAFCCIRAVFALLPLPKCFLKAFVSPFRCVFRISMRVCPSVRHAHLKFAVIMYFLAARDVTFQVKHSIECFESLF